jgi:hypothetical protein
MTIMAPRTPTAALLLLCVAAGGPLAAAQAPPALATKTYDVTDLVRQSAWILDKQPVPSDNTLRDTRAPSPAEKLVREIIAAVDPDSWGTAAGSPTIQVENGTKLVVRATNARQKQVAHFLTVLRRLADVAVVMNARLYEVDRAFYVEQIVPGLTNPRQPGSRRLVAYPGETLLRKIERHKRIMEGDALKIPPGRQAAILSWQQAVRYVAQQADSDIGQKKAYRTALEGVSFFARPTVTPDRRLIHLKLTQKVMQLAKGAMIKVNEGDKDFEELVALPDQESSASTTILVADGGTLLMPVDFRPPAPKGQERVWLLVMRPQIWIQEEERAIREGKVAPIPRK